MHIDITWNILGSAHWMSRSALHSGELARCHFWGTCTELFWGNLHGAIVLRNLRKLKQNEGLKCLTFGELARCRFFGNLHGAISVRKLKKSRHNEGRKGFTFGELARSIFSGTCTEPFLGNLHGAISVRKLTKLKHNEGLECPIFGELARSNFWGTCTVPLGGSALSHLGVLARSHFR